MEQIKKSSEMQVSIEVAAAIVKNHAPTLKSTGEHTKDEKKEDKKHEIHTDEWKALVRRDALKLARGKKLPKR
ncbi:MAG: hypothetical protein ACP5M9_03870 [Candidatus Micrarchaeia archaeon]